MNIKSRIMKMERQKAITPDTKSDPAFSLWLETLTNSELHFLVEAHESEEFREANAAKHKELKERLDEYKKQNKAH